MTPPTTSLQENTSLASVFERIYRDKVWGEGSGPGSDPVQAKPYLDYLRTLIESKQIKSVLDVGCGDRRIYEGFKGFDFCNYVGTDVVRGFQRVYRVGDIHDLHTDHCDLVIIKDVLQHLPHADNLRILRKAMEAKWVLVTNDTPKSFSENMDDIEPGGYRPLRMNLPPYELESEYRFFWKSTPFEKITQLLKGGQQLPDQTPAPQS